MIEFAVVLEVEGAEEVQHNCGAAGDPDCQDGLTSEYSPTPD